MAFVRVSVIHLRSLDVLASVVGWLYFAAWSVSFYPQIYENWKRKRCGSKKILNLFRTRKKMSVFFFLAA